MLVLILSNHNYLITTLRLLSQDFCICTGVVSGSCGVLMIFGNLKRRAAIHSLSNPKLAIQNRIGVAAPGFLNSLISRTWLRVGLPPTSRQNKPGRVGFVKNPVGLFNLASALSSARSDGPGKKYIARKSGAKTILFPSSVAFLRCIVTG